MSAPDKEIRCTWPLWGYLFPILWPRTQGVVVRYRRKYGSEGRFYHPMVRYELSDGRTLIGMSRTGWWRYPWPVGTHVAIRYSPQQPRHIEIESLAGLWGVPIVLLIGFCIVLWIIVAR